MPKPLNPTEHLGTPIQDSPYFWAVMLAVGLAMMFVAVCFLKRRRL